MSLLKANSVQIGQSTTGTNNFTLSVPSSPDGTIKLARGNSGATTSDVLSINASGVITGSTFSGVTINSSTVNGGSITSGTAVASTSGTAIDFTSIPSWVKRITVMLNGVSTATASALQIQIGGSGGVETTGYAVNTSVIRGTYNGGVGSTTSTSGFVLQNYSTSTADSVSGHLILTNISGNIWIGSGLVSVGAFNSYDVHMFAGTKTLSSVLDRVRLTTVAAATLDAGSVNILYEG